MTPLALSLPSLRVVDGRQAIAHQQLDLEVS